MHLQEANRIIDEVESAKNETLEAIESIGQQTIESIEQTGNQTLDAIGISTNLILDGIEQSAVESAQFVRSLTQNLQVSQELRLDGIAKQLTKSFTTLELKLVDGTNRVMNELLNFKSSFSSDIRILKCLEQKNDLHPQIRIFENILEQYNDRDEEERDEYAKIYKNTALYSEFFVHDRLPDLKRAIMGRSSLDNPSLVQVEMECFDPSEYCTDDYHRSLRSREAKLMILYYQVRNFQKMLINKYSNVEGITSLARLKKVIGEDLSDIEEMRNKSSCPAFKHEQFIGGGCQQYSTYKGQLLNLTNLCPLETTPVYDDLQNLTPVLDLKCQGNPGNLEWNIEPNKIKCIPDCLAYDQGITITPGIYSIFFKYLYLDCNCGP